MIALTCEHDQFKKNGKDREGRQRYICKNCGHSWTDGIDKTLGPLTTDIDRAAQAIQLLTEGMGVRATSRLTGLDKNTIQRLTVQVGNQIDKMCRNMVIGQTAAHLSIDEVWGVVSAKIA